jgi:hypothetical protein
MTQTSTHTATIETHPTANVIVRTAWRNDGTHTNSVFVGGVRQRQTSDAAIRRLTGNTVWTPPAPEGEFWQIFIQRGEYADNAVDLTTGILYPDIEMARAEKASPSMARAAAGRIVRIVRVAL